MTTVRLVAAPGRRVRLRDGSLMPAEGIDANLDTDIHLRRLHRVGDVVLGNAEVGQSEAPAPAAEADAAPSEAEEPAGAGEPASPAEESALAESAASEPTTKKRKGS